MRLTCFRLILIHSAAGNTFGGSGGGDVFRHADTSSLAVAETGKQAVQEFINQYTEFTTPGPTVPPTTNTSTGRPASPEIRALPVGILGAGVSGLYIAMMLDDLGIKYEIMEGSGRTGGRLYTHNFPKNPGKYQYYVSMTFVGISFQLTLCDA